MQSNYMAGAWAKALAQAKETFPKDPYAASKRAKIIYRKLLNKASMKAMKSVMKAKK